MKALTVFTHPAVQLEIDDASVPAYTIGKLRKHALPQAGKLTPELYQEVSSCLERVTLS